ncbi:hypothetical protein [Actinomadura sp. 9N407]|uniref:hypothetical protein n=1 Tax=Actinomadura sp. 9N407 TaxID=3375154 RepID=UPI0037991ED1
MSRREKAQSAWLALMGLGLLAGMFMMHGVTATPSPVHSSTPVIQSAPVLQPFSTSGTHGAPSTSSTGGAHGVPSANGAYGTLGAPDRQGMHEAPAGAQWGDPGHSGVHENGCAAAGSVCLALLAGLVLALVRGRALNVLLARLTSVSGPLSFLARPPPRPPSIYRLSVLRL